jgi:hypothetical protein
VGKLLAPAPATSPSANTRVASSLKLIKYENSFVVKKKSYRGDTMKTALFKMLALGLLLLVGAPPSSYAEDGPPEAGILQRLTDQSGVYNRSKAGVTPNFIVDPTWPLILPHSWLLGQVGGL